MGKGKDSPSKEHVVGLDLEQPPVKKHKKHKHKKHKKKKSIIDVLSPSLTDEALVQMVIGIPEEEVSSPFVDESPSGSQLSTSLGKTPSQVGSSPKGSSCSKRKKGKGKDGRASSDEERWLDAIESGKLEEVDDELKKIKPKDPKLMTARQRAMFERKTDKEATAEQLLALPTGYREKVLTPEMVQKAVLKSQRRKQQADEKRELDKKKTMDRLLRKQDTKPGKHQKNTGGRGLRRQVPLVMYRNTFDSITVSFPYGVDFPLAPQTGVQHRPGLRVCGVAGCANPRKYSCSKTGISLCSLQCYKANLSQVESSSRKT